MHVQGMEVQRLKNTTGELFFALTRWQYYRASSTKENMFLNNTPRRAITYSVVGLREFPLARDLKFVRNKKIKTMKNRHEVIDGPS